MTSGDHNISLRGKMIEILLKMPIQSYRMLFYSVFLTLLVFSYKGVVAYAVPPPPTPLWRSWLRPPLGRGLKLYSGFTVLSGKYLRPCPLPVSLFLRCYSMYGGRGMLKVFPVAAVWRATAGSPCACGAGHALLTVPCSVSVYACRRRARRRWTRGAAPALCAPPVSCSSCPERSTPSAARTTWPSMSPPTSSGRWKPAGTLAISPEGARVCARRLTRAGPNVPSARPVAPAHTYTQQYTLESLRK